MKGKIFASVVAIIIIAVLTWYLFIKDYNYKISFETTLPPGAVYASLASWDHLNIIHGDSIDMGARHPFRDISYTLIEKDSSFRFDWDINRTKSDNTKIVTYVSDIDNGFLQDITVPFKRNDFVKRSVSEARLFLSYLKTLEEKYEVKIVKDSTFTIPSKHIAYINLESKIQDKANMMASHIVFIMGYIREFDIQLDGNPFIKVNNIDFENNSITYEFCFPIKKTDNLPVWDNLYFKDTPETKAIKASFRGNYRSTEFAWYELIDYAKRNNIDILDQPLEIYLDDPQGGTNSVDWLADIYLPLK